LVRNWRRSEREGGVPGGTGDGMVRRRASGHTRCCACLALAAATALILMTADIAYGFRTDGVPVRDAGHSTDGEGHLSARVKGGDRRRLSQGSNGMLKGDVSQETSKQGQPHFQDADVEATLLHLVTTKSRIVQIRTG
jgi:hypothetical protein